jgi:glycosyltransferase involved in cell wall biosynthesis
MSGAGEYPRTLILGPTFDWVTGGGITLTNLFQGWPAERLAVASFDPVEVRPAPAVYQYRLGVAERRWIGPLKFAGAMDVAEGGPVEPVANGVASSGAAAGSGGRLRPLAKKAFHGVIGLLGSDEYLRPIRPSERLVAWARSFAPDLLYTQLGTWGMTSLALELAAALNVPTVLHMMDDWPEVIYRHGLLSGRLKRDLDRDFRRFVDGASACMAISDAMAREYESRYGWEWTYFHNPVEPARWRVAGAEAGGGNSAGPATEAPAVRGGDFTLVYSGRIGPGIEDSVLDICRVVAALRKDGRKVRFAIHSIHFDRGADPRFAAFDGVDLHGAIPDADMAATLGAADALALPFDFHGDAAAFARLSFPTKAPAYEATGVPILVYAPTGHAVAADAAARGWGFVVGEPDLPALAGAICRLMDDQELRQDLSRRALADVAARHEAGVVRARFAAALAAAAAPGGRPR